MFGFYAICQNKITDVRTRVPLHKPIEYNSELNAEIRLSHHHLI